MAGFRPGENALVLLFLLAFRFFFSLVLMFLAFECSLRLDRVSAVFVRLSLKVEFPSYDPDVSPPISRGVGTGKPYIHRGIQALQYLSLLISVMAMIRSATTHGAASAKSHHSGQDTQSLIKSIFHDSLSKREFA